MSIDLDGMKARAAAAAALKHNQGQFWMQQYVKPLAADVLALLADRERLQMALEAAQAALRETMAEHTETVTYYEDGLTDEQRRANGQRILARTRARLGQAQP